MPMIVMAVCYTLMGRELWGSRSIGELTQRQIDSIKSKRKVYSPSNRTFRAFIKTFSLISGCEDVYNSSSDICLLLAALSRLFYLCLS